MREHHYLPYKSEMPSCSLEEHEKASNLAAGAAIECAHGLSVAIKHNSEDFSCVQVISRQLGFDLSFSNRFQTLLTAAEAYAALGWSVIPLLGDRDPSRPKVPALPWAGFQQYHASLDEHHDWFANANFGGLGIVTGRISHLIVLDFDSDDLFKDFRFQYPELSETRTIRSARRQLPHLYFKLPDYLHLPSQKGQGVDLLSDNRYVVAPPTHIAGQAYEIIRAGMPKTLTERDIRRIQAFLAAHKAGAPISHENRQEQPTKTINPIPKPSSCDLESLYKYYCQRGGRNDALFRTSLYARDTGWQEPETQQCLVNLHVQQFAPTQHAVENPPQRQREAQNTIRSAFSRPAQLQKPRVVRQPYQLSNGLREALMQQGMTFVVRTYEALLQKGIHPGQIFTTKQAIEYLKGLVGRDSIRNALKSAYKRKALFGFSPPVNPRYAVATENPLDKQKNAFLLLSKNQKKVQMGRPLQLFRMPSNEGLCRLFEVKITYSDPLEPSDLSSARQTRMGLHRELIKRRPSSYSQCWLAKRLGVSRRTISTYNQLIPVHSRAMFLETPINWKTIQRLPFDEALQGAFLRTGQGKKYPAQRIIASRLLANGESLSLSERTVNFYWYGDVEPPVLEFIRVREKQVQKQETQAVFFAQINPSISSEPYPKPLRQPVLKPVSAVQTPPSNSRKPFADTHQEALAQHIYHTLNTPLEKRLSLVNARHIVLMQSEDRIRAVLKCLQQRKTITNPIGFLMTLLSSYPRTR